LKFRVKRRALIKESEKQYDMSAVVEPRNAGDSQNLWKPNGLFREGMLWDLVILVKANLGAFPACAFAVLRASLSQYRFNR
jgi:hypothetical protein